jgi:hypothetical protein
MLEGLTPKQNRAYRCKINDFKQQLDPKDYAILTDALEDTKTWTANGLMRALRDKGLILADTTITKHRNKQCRCFKG